MFRIVYARAIILVFLLSISGIEPLIAGAAGTLKWKYLIQGDFLLMGKAK